MILGLSHVGLTVSNLGRSLDYYRENLGCEVLSDAERKGDWIDKLTGIPGFHSRTVYLMVTASHHIEMFGFINPQVIPPEDPAKMRAGILYCVLRREGQERSPAPPKSMGRHEWPALMEEREPSFPGENETIWEDPDGVPLKIIQGVNARQTGRMGKAVDLLYPIFLTSQFDRALDFYHNLLGLKVYDHGIPPAEPAPSREAGRKGSTKWALLGTADRPFLKLVGMLEAATSSAKTWQMHKVGLSHAAFGVTHLDDYYLDLGKRGVDFRSTPQSVTLGPHRGGKAVYLNTPDGMVLEFIDSPGIQEQIRHY
jgi:catechol 2,3-dioxygenase-like lactoylglutathione lyase family enzyme